MGLAYMEKICKFAVVNLFSMRILRILCLTAAVMVMSISVQADTLGEARQLMNDGMYDRALTLLDQYISTHPRAKDYGMSAYEAGQCAMVLGKLSEAGEYYRKAASKGVNDAWLQLGRLDCLSYDFNTAMEDYSKYKNPDAQVMEERSRAERAAGFMERVENVVIIDSVTVPKKNFFEFYRLPVSAGTLTPSAQSEYPLFGNEEGTSWLTTSKDSTGRLVISRIDALTTKGTETYYYPELSDNGNAAYPSMLADGQTIYFASDGSQTIGGWDIMISTYDPDTGTYRKPQNLGMPYNSPFNDYMMVIDETNGVGWWATDRHAPDADSVTIYVFIPSDLRVNLSVDAPDLRSRAMILNYRDTWPENADYTELLNHISEIRPADVSKPSEFRFEVDGNRVLTCWDDIATFEGREALAAYFAALEVVSDLEKELSGLYSQWAEGAGSNELREYILRKEGELDEARRNLRCLRNDVYKNL